MSKVYISKNANELLKDFLRDTGHSVIEIGRMAEVDPAIECHPDIYMCDLGKRIFFGHPELLLYDYPGHAIYNGCSTGKFFIHNHKITSPDLMEAVLNEKLIPVHVAQGYSKCNCVVVDENSIITSDRGIERAVRGAGMQVLLIQPAQVHLQGYRYGFLGGASGKVGNDIIFNGDITRHSNYVDIKEFIECRGLNIIHFNQYPLTDIGSIIEEK